MEFDPETNTYSSNGPTTRLRNAEQENRDLKRRLKDLEDRVDRLEEILEEQ
ncbi:MULTISPECIES: hypothetical protein [Micrococcus]|uniref:hypothetical protein n=1 Tax=Micrococcus TaxID=1269 RepID=UPI0024AFEBA9|nr:hypothetical protein [Micrococcus yunnanensis]WHM16721.1 hypothetical protein QL063_00625 [Micrococcus yunnanensis]